VSLTKVTNDVSAVTQLVDENGLVRAYVDNTGDLIVDGDVVAGGGSITYIPSTEKGAFNGVAELDGAGKVPASQLTVSAMEYKGVWDASGGVYPTSPNQGDYWRISVAGTISGTAYAINDAIIYNGTTWDKIDNTDAITSVNGQTSGAVVLESDDIGLSATVFGLATHVQAALVQAESEIDADVLALANHLADTVDAHDASAISTTTTFGATNVQSALTQAESEIDADVLALANHLSDTTDAHDASAISVTPAVAGGTDVQASLAGLQTQITDHLNDTTDAHDASAISITSPIVGSSDVQGALTGIYAGMARVGVWETAASVTTDATKTAMVFATASGNNDITGDATIGGGNSVFTLNKTGMYEIEVQAIVTKTVAAARAVDITIETVTPAAAILVGGRKLCSLQDANERQTISVSTIINLTTAGATLSAFITGDGTTVAYQQFSSIKIKYLGDR
jgi:hypothetical protein